MQAIAHPPLLRDIENGTGKTITQKLKINLLGTLKISGSAMTVHFILLYLNPLLLEIADRLMKKEAIPRLRLPSIHDHGAAYHVFPG